MENNPMCKEDIGLKYKTEFGGWFSKFPKGSYGVGLWNDIHKEVDQLKRSSKANHLLTRFRLLFLFS